MVDRGWWFKIEEYNSKCSSRYQFKSPRIRLGYVWRVISFSKDELFLSADGDPNNGDKSIKLWSIHDKNSSPLKVFQSQGRYPFLNEYSSKDAFEL